MEIGGKEQEIRILLVRMDSRWVLVGVTVMQSRNRNLGD